MNSRILRMSAKKCASHSRYEGIFSIHAVPINEDLRKILTARTTNNSTAIQPTSVMIIPHSEEKMFERSITKKSVDPMIRPRVVRGCGYRSAI